MIPVQPHTLPRYIQKSIENWTISVQAYNLYYSADDMTLKKVTNQMNAMLGNSLTIQNYAKKIRLVEEHIEQEQQQASQIIDTVA